MFYKMNCDKVIELLDSNREGLSDEKASFLLKKNGHNELKENNKVSAYKLFFETLKAPLVIILLIAAIVQIFFGEIIESSIIILVVLINSLLEVVQTKKAENSLASLKALSAPFAKVLRNGKSIVVPAKDLVVGDIVIVEAGDYIPADGRLLEAQTLKVLEGMLTGESEPILKNTDEIEKDSSIGDQKNMVFSGSVVVYGRGKYIVTATAMGTQMGKIADLIESAENKLTPLQIKIEEFSKKLGVAILIISVLIFIIQVAKGYLLGIGNNIILDSFMFSVAVAVAAIPEALSSIVTIILALGTKNMAKKQVIIRKLQGVETLGATSVICTDKTGTLTQNKMTVVDYFVYSSERKDILSLNLISTLCNDSQITEDGKEIGDPTEVALINHTNKYKIDTNKLREKYTRLNEIPFDSDRKLMSTVNDIDGDSIMFTKGAPDVLFQRCKYTLRNGETVELTDEILNEYKKKNEEYSKKALRVLAFAIKDVPELDFIPALDDEVDLVLVGIIAMIDPPREEVSDAIKQAKSAGVKTVMITGDHKTTAAAIAKQIGIMQEKDLALTGEELDNYSDEELDKNLEQISVYARVSPENKIRIVRAWQNKNKIVAMTGDGVNDAPALKQADIGISMGSGTDVAKDASTMVLVDDNFNSIVGAVKEGRTVYNNIKKSITYLFSGNLGAIISIMFAVLAGWSNPFTSLQLLFINLINDSLPAIALGFEKPERGIMDKKPRSIDESILCKETLKTISRRGILIGIAVIIAQYIGMKTSVELGVAMAFSTLIMSRTLQTLPARSNSETAFNLGFFSNKYVIYAVIICTTLYLLMLLPIFRSILSIPSSFGVLQAFICLGLSLVCVSIMEVSKKFMK